MDMKKINFFDFIGSEGQNKFITIANLKGHLGYVQELDEIYKDLNDVFMVDCNNDMHYIVATLFLQAHNEFYISISQLLSSHLGKSFVSLRIAIEAAFLAYYFTKNPEHSKRFLEKESKLHKRIFWRIKSFMKENPTEYPLAQKLISAHEIMSNISAHSSFTSMIFKHKHIKDKERNEEFLTLNYFDDLSPVENFLGYYFCILMFFLRVYKLFYESFYKNELKIHYPPREERVRKFEENIMKQYQKYSLTKIAKEIIKKESDGS